MSKQMDDLILNCDNCEVALSGGVDTYGIGGDNLCYQCYFAQIQPEPARPIKIDKAIFRKYVYPDQKMISYSDKEGPQIRSQMLQRTPNENLVVQLERLATLHKAGVLTSEEFAEAKCKILRAAE